jgi:hypothetical protein
MVIKAKYILMLQNKFFTKAPLHLKLISIIFISLLLSNCNNKGNEIKIVQGTLFDIGDFEPINNYGSKADSIFEIDVHWANAMKGIVIPSEQQTESGYFKFSFKIKNKTEKAARFRYSIYYQNESYKFQETNDSTNEYFRFQSENFYGSWGGDQQGLRITDKIDPDGAFHTITDSFRIDGNPRFESKYFSDGLNNSWKRNPRMGTYEFLLFVCLEEYHKANKLPKEFTDLSLSNNGIYTNPFDFIKFRLKDNLNTSFIYSNKKLVVKAKLDLSKIYVNPENFDKGFDERYLCSTCNYEQNTKYYACFEQFRPVIISDTYLKNIPLILNVNKNEYTVEDYYWNKHFTPMEERIFTIPMRPRTPCESVRYNKDEKCIELRNPASKPFDWRKEISGVKTRHGLSYGKFRVKCKLTRLLNDQNMWNGITNAIWLINQSLDPWNSVRPCKNGGYMAEYLGDDNSPRSEVISYSEIDFEIIKALPYCPNCNFPPYFTKSVPDKSKYNYWAATQPDEITKEADKIFVACTNWDMACGTPTKHAGGCVSSNHAGKDFSFFRWSKSSRGVTGGELMSDKEIFGGAFYYFEIEWKPTEIIWKIGPSPDKLKEICYMDSSHTSIPNNQMLLIIDQEFHNTKWWYGAQFEQENIPFPSEEIIGKIYEVTIE